MVCGSCQYLAKNSVFLRKPPRPLAYHQSPSQFDRCFYYQAHVFVPLSLILCIFSNVPNTPISPGILTQRSFCLECFPSHIKSSFRTCYSQSQWYCVGVTQKCKISFSSPDSWVRIISKTRLPSVCSPDESLRSCSLPNSYSESPWVPSPSPNLFSLHLYPS